MSGRFISQAAVANPAWLSWLWDSWGTNWKAIVHQTHFENCNSWLKCLWSLFDSCKRVKLGPRRQETWVQGGKKAGSKVASWDSAAPTRLHLIALICAILKNLHLPTDAYSLKEFLSAREVIVILSEIELFLVSMRYLFDSAKPDPFSAFDPHLRWQRPVFLRRRGTQRFVVFFSVSEAWAT